MRDKAETRGEWADAGHGVRVVNKAMIEDFYPTPKDLISKMLKGVKASELTSVLEPSAGKGDICDRLKNWIESTYNRRSNIIDVVEINPDMQALLRGKGYNLVHDDFLQFNTHRPYELIIANFPFSSGDAHLAKALSMIERSGGELVCLVNAETIRNPYTNLRQIVAGKLAAMNADVEYIAGAFQDAERPTDVEVALVRVKVDRPEAVPILLDELKKADDSGFVSDQAHEQIVERDFVGAMVARFDLEVRLGIRLIEEYFALKPYILSQLPRKDADGEVADRYSSSPLIELNVKGQSAYGDVNGHIHDYLPLIREKYWEVLINDPRYIGQYTSNIVKDLNEKLRELRHCDFNRFNIDQLSTDLAMRVAKGVEKAILDLFDRLSCKHTYNETIADGNVHYYNGWRTNKAWKVNDRVIIPMHGYSAYSKSLDYRYREGLGDMVKVFNYLSTEKNAGAFLLSGRRGQDIFPGKLADFRYFETKIYKKGTCHIKFLDKDLLDKFNIFASQRKGWLPPAYGKAAYEDLDKDDRAVVDDFQGAAEYQKVMENADFYIVEDALALIGDGRRG
jgi:hypothetical protein